ncbi:MAG: hypothetical protein ACYTFI_21490 [Planctomycetota bacterium]|jgi:hypothetical protein
MPLVPSRSTKRGGETERVLEHYRKTIHRVLDFFGYTIDDVVNDPRKRDHVRRAYLISLRIGRELDAEPWRTEATKSLGDVIARRLAAEASSHDRGGDTRSQ